MAGATDGAEARSGGAPIPRWHRRAGIIVLASALVSMAGACASAPVEPPTYRTEVVRIDPDTAGVEPPAADSVRAPAALPKLPVEQRAEAQTAAGRLQLEAVGQDLRAMLRGIADSYGLGYQIAETVRGNVNVNLRGVTLEQALDELVTRRGYVYTIQDGVLRVRPATMQTRIFALDYVSLSRFGTATTVVQRRLGSVGQAGQSGIGGGGQGNFGNAGGGDVISSVTVADLWNEIQVAMEALVFSDLQTFAGQQALDTLAGEATAIAPAATPAPAQPQGGFGGGGVTGPFSRVSPDGRRLIINPIAGSIVVTAPTATLDQIETFIAAFEGSVQRQVLVEAKIVEVVLSREFEFGIDWSALGRIGNLDISFGQTGLAGSGVQLTLDGGTGEVTAVLDALDTQGDVRVLSSPRISMLNNQRAVINVSTDEVFFSVNRTPILGPQGQVISFSTEVQPLQISVGIVMDVLAQISSDNEITMNVRPVVTDVLRIEEVDLGDGTQARAPVIDRRETDTVARVRNGETIVIGGLMQTRKIVDRSQVPILGSIPLLGRLFQHSTEREEKRELVIFVTPSIVAGQVQAGAQ